MDLKQIHELIKLINKSNIGEISIEDKDGKVTIKQKDDPIVQMHSAPQPHHVYQISNPPPQQAQPEPTAQQSTAAPAPAAKTAAENNYITIKSPMIGTFYRRPAPDKPNFLEVGTEITVGKVLCIIEAMKLFNEIESEHAGTVVKVLVEDNSPVEFDQPLFIIDPS